MVQNQATAAGATPIAAYSVRSFSKAYSLSIPTVNRLLRSGALRRTKVGGRTIILKRDAIGISAISLRSTATQRQVSDPQTATNCATLV